MLQASGVYIPSMASEFLERIKDTKTSKYQEDIVKAAAVTSFAGTVLIVYETDQLVLTSGCCSWY